MQIIEAQEQAWIDWKANNTDPYGSRIMSYAEDWANLMEAAISEGSKLEDCAEATSRQADTDGITGFMHGAAVAVLSKIWQHGDQLRRWHNLKTQLGNEGIKANETGGVLNPALLRIQAD